MGRKEVQQVPDAESGGDFRQFVNDAEEEYWVVVTRLGAAMWARVEAEDDGR